MSRSGITLDQVATMADTMVAEGITPTIKGVRERLGTGSDGTIHRHLFSWREAHQQLTAVTIELPAGIINTITQEIERAKAEARAEIEGRLLMIQSDANEMSASFETLESGFESQVEEVSALTTTKNKLLEQTQEQGREIDRLSKECERERYSAEHARIETAQLRNKQELQEEKQSELSSMVETLKSLNASESQAKHDAEKEAAVFSAKLESELQRSGTLFNEKEALLAQLEGERQSAESARIEASRIAFELEMRIAAIAAQESVFKELKEICDFERQARVASEMKYAAMAARVEIQGQEVIPHVQPSIPE